MTQTTSLLAKDLNEKQVIEQAYAATLDPERLKEFELFWESYLDAGLQGKGSPASSIDLSTVQIHISRALEILERMRHQHVTESKAQNIVDSNYGLGFIINLDGKIIARNSDARDALQNAMTISDMGLDEFGLSEIRGWLRGRNRDENKPVLFVNVFLMQTKHERACSLRR